MCSLPITSFFSSMLSREQRRCLERKARSGKQEASFGQSLPYGLRPASRLRMTRSPLAVYRLPPEKSRKRQRRHLLLKPRSNGFHTRHSRPRCDREGGTPEGRREDLCAARFPTVNQGGYPGCAEENLRCRHRLCPCHPHGRQDPCFWACTHNAEAPSLQESHCSACAKEQGA